MHLILAMRGACVSSVFFSYPVLIMRLHQAQWNVCLRCTEAVSWSSSIRIDEFFFSSFKILKDLTHLENIFDRRWVSVTYFPGLS